MAETTEFELVSPEKLLVSEPVEMVVVPGTEGFFGALPRHAPFLSTLEPGVISIYEAGQVKKKIFVAGGFAEVNETRCTVLAEEAVLVENIDRGAVDAQLRDLKVDLEKASDAAEKAVIASKIKIAEAKMAAASA